MHPATELGVDAVPADGIDGGVLALADIAEADVAALLSRYGLQMARPSPAAIGASPKPD